MKINPSIIKVTPKEMGFNFCVFGTPSEEISAWIKFWNLKTELSGKYTNIFIGDNDVNLMFTEAEVFDYVDGFSPNLNKHLHLGHFSNLIVAKAFQSLGLGKKYIAILGDTLDGSVEKQDAFDAFLKYCNLFGYKIDDIYYASGQKMLDESILLDGEDNYVGTKIFDIDGQKEVAIKSSGATTYFYQDVALAQKLNGSTLYLTGFEQNPHFKKLKKLFPRIAHVGLGLVNIDGIKMSSSEGNTLMFEDVFNALLSKFNSDDKLAWNVLAGHILKYSPATVKNISMQTIDSPETSFGLYFSYTLAKMKSAGMTPNDTQVFNSNALKFKLIKAKHSLAPNILFEEMIDLTKSISSLYTQVRIKDNPEGQAIYQPMLDDLLLGMKALGMFDVEKV